MNAPKRLTLLERLQIAKAAHALALERAKTEPPAPAALPQRPEPAWVGREEAIRAAAEIERSPLHVCGVRMVLCADCREWVCRAPGHLRHVCPAFSQVEP